MEKTLILKSAPIFIFLWGFGIVFLWYRPRIEIFWKIIATVLFAFYVWFFHEEVSRGFSAIKADWFAIILSFLKDFLSLAFVSLFLLWPLFLMVIFYKSDDISAENLLKVICIMTVVVWILFVAYVMYDKKIDPFLFDKVRSYIPFAKP
jgi:hypothetical protein